MVLRSRGRRWSTGRSCPLASRRESSALPCRKRIRRKKETHSVVEARLRLWHQASRCVDHDQHCMTPETIGSGFSSDTTCAADSDQEARRRQQEEMQSALREQVTMRPSKWT